MLRALSLLSVVLVIGSAGCTDDDVAEAPPTSSVGGAPFYAGRPEVTPTVPVITVGVFFVDADSDPPQLVEVGRQVPETDVPRNAALALMAGPTPEERDRGLTLLTSGATGVRGVTVVDAVATVELTGACEPEDGPFTVADLLTATLMALPDLVSVHVRGPGTPTCLQPA